MTPLSRAGAQMQAAAHRIDARRMAAASEYDRERMFPMLFPLRSYVETLLSMSSAERIERLEQHASAIVKQLAAGSWMADSNRLIALRQAIAGEKAALEKRRAA